MTNENAGIQAFASFLAARRRARGLTQQGVADALGVSFQAVSKWESAVSYPNIELLPTLAGMLGVTVDALLAGQNAPGLTYSQAGVDVNRTDALKAAIAAHMETDDPRVLNGVGPFASLYDIHFPDMAQPVLVLKAEEPGSKQKLAAAYGYTESVCHDMINHLVNDIAVMGARPLAVLDTIICGGAAQDTLAAIVKGIADACRVNGCALVGGETSIQPEVIDKSTFILTATVAGVVERARIIDGATICEGDAVLAVASNGLHTNGYSLVRLLMKEATDIWQTQVNGESFLEAIMKPHTAYRACINDLLAHSRVHGMAHITGGGIADNVRRVMPNGLCAQIDLSRVRCLPVFSLIKQRGAIDDAEMLRTFNCGVGLVVIVPRDQATATMARMQKYYDCYAIGEVVRGAERVAFANNICW